MKHYSRRQFIKQMAALTAATATTSQYSRGGVSQVLADSGGGQPASFSPLYLNALENPQLALLNDMFYAISDDRTVSFILYDMTHNELLVAMEPEAPLPIASAFKSGVLMMFVQLISPQVWNTVPVMYWNATGASQVAPEYQDAWNQHHNILNDLYDMIVFSDNPATGRVMAYIADWFGSTQPIALFNDWSHDVVGISHLSGLSSWGFGIPSHMDWQDSRYMGRDANIDHQPLKYLNLFTARDMGMYYTWFLDNLDADQQLICGTLLNVIASERDANIERLALQNQGMSFSKNGNLGRDDSPAGIVITDAGIIVHGNGTFYIASFLSVNAEYRVVPAMFALAHEVLRGDHDAEIAAARKSKTPLVFDYDQYLQTAYPETATLVDNLYNYGFVRNEGVPVYSQPEEGYQVRNPVISASRFGVHLLMQGAIVRFILVDADWVELIPDDETDNVRERLSNRVFLKRGDLWTIPYDYVQPIDYFIDPATTPEQKYIIIQIPKRELSVMEAGNVIIKTPIALNIYATPRGSYPIMTKWFARSMQAWAPGVPFTTFFHKDGYAIHGSPWQRWEATVNQENIYTRISAGCINVPNWVVSLGYYTRPLDELLFRWMGGLQRPESEIREFARGSYGALRVFVVDDYNDLFRHSLPTPVTTQGVTWDQVIANISYMELTAPDSFFKSTV